MRPYWDNLSMFLYVVMGLVSMISFKWALDYKDAFYLMAFTYIDFDKCLSGAYGFLFNGHMFLMGVITKTKFFFDIFCLWYLLFS